jgi:hypothetical protein
MQAIQRVTTTETWAKQINPMTLRIEEIGAAAIHCFYAKWAH